MLRPVVERSRKRRGNPALKPRAVRQRMTGLPRFARNDGGRDDLSTQLKSSTLSLRAKRGNPVGKMARSATFNHGGGTVTFRCGIRVGRDRGLAILD